jgi:ArsR family transcriptional regulator
MSIYDIKKLAPIAEAFNALANPNRLAIFLHLVACCPPGKCCDFHEELGRCVGDLGEGLRIAPSTISHHIKELRRAGLIHVTKKGKYSECSVNGPAVLMLADILSGRMKLESSPDAVDLFRHIP